MAKNRNGGEIPTPPPQPKSEFDKFITSALDAVVTSVPSEEGDTKSKLTAMDNPEAGAKFLAVGIEDKSPPAKTETTPPELRRTQSAPQPDVQNLDSFQSMLREEEARIANRQQGKVPQVAVVPEMDRLKNNVRKLVAVEDQSLAAFRATLRTEEDRLRAMPAPPPLPALPGLDSVSGTAYTLHTAKEPVIREGADATKVEVFMLLRRVVAGQYLAYGTVYHEVMAVIEKLRKEVEVTNVS